MGWEEGTLSVWGEEGNLGGLLSSQVYLSVEETGGKGRAREMVARGLGPTLLVLKMEEEAMRQGMWAASRRLEKREHAFLPPRK